MIDYYLLIIALVLIPLCDGLPGVHDDDDGLPGDQGDDLPCVMRYNQLYCSSPGTSFPAQKISQFINDNKALLRRMYGETQEQTTVTKTTVRIVRTFTNTGFISAPLTQPGYERVRRDVLEGTWEEMVENLDDEDTLEKNGGNKTDSRMRRQAEIPEIPEEDKTKYDVCESKVEVTTPYWASNSNGKVRAILNNEQFEQAIHQEICSQPATLRCNHDCFCQQKYKWHRLLAYDPNNDCAGVFMDWFLFPSCCTCRCNKNPFLGK